MAYTGYINEEVRKMYGIPYHKLTARQKKILHADSIRRAKLIDEREQAVLRNNLKAFEDEAKMERVLASIYKDCQKQILADVAETMAKVKKAGGTWSYANQSALTRSKGLFDQITAELTKLGQKEQIVFTQGLGNIYTDQFLRQVFELGQTMPVKANFNRLNPALIKKTLDYPWSGAMFSDRLWLDKETLGRNLRVGLTQSMILGEGIPEITDRIQRGINTSRYNAERVARTETKRVTYVAHNDAYEDMGVKELKYYTAGEKSGSKVCDICNADNGKIYKRGEEPSLPRHPNCKCVYIPHVSDTFGDNELNELTGSVRGAENYEKWKKEQEEKLKKTATLSKEETAYQKIMDDLDSQHKAKTLEIAGYQSSFDKLEAERVRLSGVRRGLQEPQEAGFKTEQEFTLYDKKLTADQQAIKDKLLEAQRDLADIERDRLYLQTVGVSKYGTLENYRAIRKALRNTPNIDYDTYADELLQMVVRMDEDALAIHTNLTNVTVNNVYNKRNAGWYSPAERRVVMDMADNSHERALGNGLKGSWQTKFHEEGHQIDHLLEKVDSITGGTAGTSHLWAFTDPRTATGTAMREAIKEDLLSFVNQAIDHYNGTHTGGKLVKHLDGFDKIPREARFAFDEYFRSLTANGMDRKVTCQLGIVTDAIGLYTRDRLSRNTLSVSAWGHASYYNKDRGVSGCTSETWATFFALRTCGDTEEVELVKKFMPNTWSVMDGVFHNIAKYVATNTLAY